MIQFKEAAEQIRKSGTARKLTVRELLGLFGQQRRGRHAAAQIRKALRREKLETIPSFEVMRMDAPILLQPKNTEAIKEELKAESTVEGVLIASEGREVVLSIGQLEQANRPPLRGTRQDTVTKAITMMMQKDVAYLAVMTGARSVDGLLSWKTIGRAWAAKKPKHTVEHYLASPRFVEIDTPPV